MCTSRPHKCRTALPPALQSGSSSQLSITSSALHVSCVLPSAQWRGGGGYSRTSVKKIPERRNLTRNGTLYLPPEADESIISSVVELSHNFMRLVCLVSASEVFDRNIFWYVDIAFCFRVPPTTQTCGSTHKNRILRHSPQEKLVSSSSSQRLNLKRGIPKQSP